MFTSNIRIEKNVIWVGLVWVFQNSVIDRDYCEKQKCSLGSRNDWNIRGHPSSCCQEGYSNSSNHSKTVVSGKASTHGWAPIAHGVLLLSAKYQMWVGTLKLTEMDSRRLEKHCLAFLQSSTIQFRWACACCCCQSASGFNLFFWNAVKSCYSSYPKLPVTNTLQDISTCRSSAHWMFFFVAPFQLETKFQISR